MGLLFPRLNTLPRGKTAEEGNKQFIRDQALLRCSSDDHKKLRNSVIQAANQRAPALLLRTVELENRETTGSKPLNQLTAHLLLKLPHRLLSPGLARKDNCI